MSDNLYIGLMSGTSLDGVDAVLVNFAEDTAEIIARLEKPFPKPLHDDLETAIREWDNLNHPALAKLDGELADLYTDAVTDLLDRAGVPAASITAVGCHGQTVSHQPDANPPFTMQLGDGKKLAAATGITVVNDFRAADIALGGQGAPLAPAFHEWAFMKNEPTAVVNIGGIANITVLDPEAPVSGYDTGPGNTLLDAWCYSSTGNRFDNNGEWAATGEVHEGLLNALLSDPYFAKAAPKSTGREYFNPDWLQEYLRDLAEISPVDIQATLTELTAITITTEVKRSKVRKLFVCGGGALNKFLMQRMSEQLSPVQVFTTEELGIPPMWVEAAAFAWLARARINNDPASRPSVTGASKTTLLGNICSP